MSLRAIFPIKNISDKKRKPGQKASADRGWCVEEEVVCIETHSVTRTPQQPARTRKRREASLSKKKKKKKNYLFSV